MPRLACNAESPCRRPSAQVARLAAASIVGLTSIVGCSGGAFGLPPTAAPIPAPMTSSVVASPSAALCSAAAEFNAAVAAIGNIDAAKVGIDGAKPALQNLQSAGRDLACAAQAQFGPEVDSLTTAVG